VNCARSVIELMTLYWPHSIDVLQPERASVDGFRPIFFSSQGNVILPLVLWPHESTDVRMDSAISRDLSLVMAKGNQSSSEQINVNALFFLTFTKLLTGPNPGILVRDNDARQRLKEKLGERSIIM